MHYIIGAVNTIKGQLPSNVRLDYHVPILRTPSVEMATYLVDVDDDIERLNKALAILMWCRSNNVPRLNINDDTLVGILSRLTGHDVSVRYTHRVETLEFPEWWLGPNYIK